MKLFSQTPRINKGPWPRRLGRGSGRRPADAAGVNAAAPARAAQAPQTERDRRARYTNCRRPATLGVRRGNLTVESVRARSPPSSRRRTRRRSQRPHRAPEISLTSSRQQQAEAEGLAAVRITATTRAHPSLARLTLRSKLGDEASTRRRPTKPRPRCARSSASGRTTPRPGRCWRSFTSPRAATQRASKRSSAGPPRPAPSRAASTRS